MKKERIPWNRVDLTGQKFGKLTVIKRYKTKKGRSLWECSCDCGKITKSVTTKRLRTGHTKSCGCLLHQQNWNWQGYGELSKAYITVIHRNATNRGLEFKLTTQELWEVFLKQNRKCALTGEELTFSSNYHTNKLKQTASLDRINSNKGYTLDNIQWVHKHINILKRDIDQDRFIELCKKVSRNFT